MVENNEIPPLTASDREIVADLYDRVAQTGTGRTQILARRRAETLRTEASLQQARTNLATVRSNLTEVREGQATNQAMVGELKERI